jgi:prepilin signal peptidase PulO-like enzyme (type II secretory pathway)
VTVGSLLVWKGREMRDGLEANKFTDLHLRLIDLHPTRHSAGLASSCALYAPPFRYNMHGVV